MHKLKAFGLALVAVFALSAVVASAASAAGAFTAAGAGVAVTGTQTATAPHKFTTTHGTVTCTTADFHGTTTAAVSTDLKLVPTYSGCKFAGLKAEVTQKSCYYTFTAGDTIGGNANQISATVHLECSTAGDSITVEIVGSKCVVTVPPQTIENGIVLTNSGTASEMDVLATLNITGIDYNVDEPTECPNPSMVTSHTEANFASYSGEATVTAPGGVTVH